MKEYPILFSGPMVRAILEGRKTQTRRVIKKVPPEAHKGCPYGKPNDRLWVREAWAKNVPGCGSQNGYSYKADHLTDSDGPTPIIWKPSIHMPRAACRIILEIERVRVEPLQKISESDAQAEGVASVEEFKNLWNSINADRGFGWDANPWVWVIQFRRIEIPTLAGHGKDPHRIQLSICQQPKLQRVAIFKCSSYLTYFQGLAVSPLRHE